MENMSLIYLTSNIEAIEVYQDAEKIWTQYIQVDSLADRIFLPITASFRLVPRNEAEPFSAEIKFNSIPAHGAATVTPVSLIK